MLYSSADKRPPRTERPKNPSFTPNGTAAALEDDDEALPDVLEEPPVVVVVLEVPLLQVGVEVDTLPLYLVKVLQSMTCSLWTFTAPAIWAILGNRGVVKFPVKSRAPPILVSSGKLKACTAGSSAIWKRPPTTESPFMVMLVRDSLSSIVIPPEREAKFPTVVKFGA